MHPPDTEKGIENNFAKEIKEKPVVVKEML